MLIVLAILTIILSTHPRCHSYIGHVIIQHAYDVRMITYDTFSQTRDYLTSAYVSSPRNYGSNYSIVGYIRWRLFVGALFPHSPLSPARDCVTCFLLIKTYE